MFGPPSCRAITYKGMLTGGHSKAFFPDPQDEMWEGHVGVVHSDLQPIWKACGGTCGARHRYILNDHQGLGFEGDVDGAPHVLGDMESGVKLTPVEIRYIPSSGAVRSDIALVVEIGIIHTQVHQRPSLRR